MAAPITPAFVRAYGNEAWVWVNTIAVITAPTQAELRAAGGFNLTGVLFGDQEGASATTEKVTLPRRMTETVQFEANGATTWTMADLLYGISPQAAAGADGKKAFEALAPEETGFLVQRFGIVGTTDFTTGDFVNIFPCQVAAQAIVKTSADANGVVAVRQAVSIIDTPRMNVAVV